MGVGDHKKRQISVSRWEHRCAPYVEVWLPRSGATYQSTLHGEVGADSRDELLGVSDALVGCTEISTHDLTVVMYLTAFEGSMQCTRKLRREDPCLHVLAIEQRNCAAMLRRAELPGRQQSQQDVKHGVVRSVDGATKSSCIAEEYSFCQGF